LAAIVEQFGLGPDDRVLARRAVLAFFDAGASSLSR
jgi:hypothetical protein